MIAHEMPRRRFSKLAKIDRRAVKEDAKLDQLEREFKRLKEMVEEVLDKRE
jgi:hypothetical protein